jgi:acyl-CoA thioesterase-1
LLNHFLYHLASGHAWFSCGLLFLLLLTLDLRGAFLNRPRRARAARVLLIASMCVAAASTTPVRIWLAGPLIVACLAYTFIGFANRSPSRGKVYALIAAVCVLLALGLELPYHLTRPPRESGVDCVYVVSDSLAAGMGGEKMTWPTRLQELTGVEVRDLSFAGANAHTALRQQLPVVEHEANDDAWVLVSIGGNDMLGGTTSDEFCASLDQLLAAARGDPKHPRVVLMLELPLIPGAWSFGACQRRLAAKHGVILIPKRVMAGVVLDQADVVDGLHLSPAGHERMAQELAPWVGRHSLSHR